MDEPINELTMAVLKDLCIGYSGKLKYASLHYENDCKTVRIIKMFVDDKGCYAVYEHTITASYCLTIQEGLYNLTTPVPTRIT